MFKKFPCLITSPVCQPVWVKITWMKPYIQIMDEKWPTWMKKMENLRIKKENPETSKIKIKIKSSTHVKFGLVQKSGYSGPLVLRNYKKQRKKREVQIGFLCSPYPLFFPFWFPLVPVVQKLATKKHWCQARTKWYYLWIDTQ